MNFHSSKMASLLTYNAISSLSPSPVLYPPKSSRITDQLPLTLLKLTCLTTTSSQCSHKLHCRVKTDNKNVVIQLSHVYFTTEEIQSSWMQLDVNKAKGPHRIRNALLKNLHKSLPKSLCLHFNLIACKAHFPTKWKVAEIVPIYKDGDKHDASNYRPISLLSVVSKLLETLIFNKLIPVVYPTLNPAQHGFWPKRSTTTNLIE